MLFDGVLNLRVPHDCKMVGYADDFPFLVAAKSATEMVSKGRRALSSIDILMEDNALQIDNTKTKAIIVRGRQTTVSKGTAFDYS